MARPVQPPDLQQAELKQTDPQRAANRRRGVRLTVLVLFTVALAIYVGFILSGVLGGAPS